MDRIDLYLHRNVPGYYANTSAESERVTKFVSLYTLAKSVHDTCPYCKPENLDKWRKAYLGTLNALDINTGEESKKKSRQLRKIVYEMVESKVDNSIPMPKMKPRYKTDHYLVERTESYLKYEVDRILTKFNNDRSERATYIDGTSWYKVWWDSLDNTHERSGDVKIAIRTADQIIPQPGVKDYKELEYIFERQELSLTRIYDLYGRLITPQSDDTNSVPVVSCYYLNENRIVGLFMWAEHSMQVICDEKDWQIRKLRTCSTCGTIVPQSKVCPNCGSTHFKYKNATTEILDEDIMEIYNPYEVGESTDPNAAPKGRVFIAKGTEIPYYNIRQLPFVPRPAVSSMDTIYGISEPWITLDMQDGANKLFSKAIDKALKAGAVITKPEKIKLGDKDDTIKVIGVRSQEEAAQIQCKQIVSDLTQDLAMATQMYENARDASGVTESFQGKTDTTAISGKAKQYAAAQSAGRIESLRVMKSAAFAGVYELVLKYLLAFSDEDRVFTRVLPDGSTSEQIWNKYIFLAKDKYGQIYYRDDFEFDTDIASTLTQNRTLMWQEIQDKYINGALGTPNEPRTLELYWNLLSQFQYPMAKEVVAGIKENAQHIPYEIEQMIMSNPEIMQQVVAMVQAAQTGSGRGGARPNSGPAGNGATQAANIERTNERNRSQNRETVVSAQQGGPNASI